MEIPDNEDLISEELLAQYRKEDVVNGVRVSLETKALGAATLLFTFLLFLIVISWDHFRQDIRALYLRDPTDQEKLYTQLPTYQFERQAAVKAKPE